MSNAASREPSSRDSRSPAPHPLQPPLPRLLSRKPEKLGGNPERVRDFRPMRRRRGMAPMSPSALGSIRTRGRRVVAHCVPLPAHGEGVNGDGGPPHRVRYLGAGSRLGTGLPEDHAAPGPASPVCAPLLCPGFASRPAMGALRHPEPTPQFGCNVFPFHISHQSLIGEWESPRPHCPPRPPEPCWHCGEERRPGPAALGLGPRTRAVPGAGWHHPVPAQSPSRWWVTS